MRAVHAELDRALRGPFTLPLALDLRRPHRYVVLSDQHKGGGDGADEFVRCKAAYHAALAHYREADFTLVLLGDVEELWEQSFSRVAAAHRDSLELEGSFPAGRYYRIWGNHDDAWMEARSVRRHVGRYMPTEAVYEGLRFELTDGGDPVGTMLCVHGHQGTLGSDRLRYASRLAVRVWRHIQRLTGVGQTTPARDACLRGKHDRTLYEWAAVRDRMVLVAGHTHRPVWSSKTHLQILEAEMELVEAAQRDLAGGEGSGESVADRGDPGTAAEAGRLALRAAELAEEIVDRRKKSPPCNDTRKSIPCYFNTGCCKYESGSITGIEIEDGRLALIRWKRDTLAREVLESSMLREIFAALGGGAPVSA